MCNISYEKTAESFFGNVISTYSRAQAIEDGVLIDPGSMAREAGFKWPVALTADAWADCVVWAEDDSAKQIHQDQAGRLWDVLFMASHAVRTSQESVERILFQLLRVPRDGRSTEAVLVTLRMIVGPGDSGEPVITILLLHEG
jgi:type I site-specific restriction endonuclease